MKRYRITQDDLSKEIKKDRPCFRLPAIPQLENIDRDRYKDSKYLSYKLSLQNKNQKMKQTIKEAESQMSLFYANTAKESNKNVSSSYDDNDKRICNELQSYVRTAPVTLLLADLKNSITSRIGSSLNYQKEICTNHEIEKEFLDEIRDNYQENMIRTKSKIFIYVLGYIDFYPKKRNLIDKIFKSRSRENNLDGCEYYRHHKECPNSQHFIKLKRPVEFEDIKSALIQSIELQKIKIIFKFIEKMCCIFKAKCTHQPKLYPCFKVMMTLKLVEFIMSNVDLYVCYFESLTSSRAGPLLKIFLVIKNGNIEFEPSIQEMECMILSVLDNVEKCFLSQPSDDLVIPNEIKDIIESVKLNENLHQTYVNRLKSALKRHLSCMNEILNDIREKYEFLVNGKTENEIKELTKTDHSLKKISDEIHYFTMTKAQIFEIPLYYNYPVIQLDCENFMSDLRLLIKDFISKILLNFCDMMHQENLNNCEDMKKVKNELLSVPQSSEEMLVFKQNLKVFQTEGIKKLDERLKLSEAKLMYLMDFPVLNDEVMVMNANTFSWRKSIQPIITQCVSILENSRIKFEEQLQEKSDLLRNEIEELAIQVQEFDCYGEFEKVSHYTEEMNMTVEQLIKIRNSIESINKEESLLKFEKSFYPDIEKVQNYIDPFIELYQLINDWKETVERWMAGPLADLSSDVVTEKLLNFQKEWSRLEKVFNKRIRSQTEDEDTKKSSFQPRINTGSPLKLVISLSSRATDFKVIISLNIPAHNLDSLSNISINAFKEYSLEQTMMKMMNEWESTEFDFKPYRDTDVCLLASVEHIQTLLDDHFMKLQTMKGSSFAHPIKDKLQASKDEILCISAVINYFLYFCFVAFESKLVLVQETLDEWLMLQASWLYLEPIFFSEDIMLQMPAEGKLFKIVDRSWRKMMSTAQNQTKVMEFATIPHNLEELRSSNAKIEKINHGLNAYLEVKRLYFPRFFFLSNDEMLEILSETKDPTRVQPHLKKCFEGIDRLKFDQNNDIHAMYSSEGEEVQFQKSVCTADARGQVEKWLLQVQNEMLGSIHSVLKAALQDYSDDTRSTWITKWPGQVVLCASQIIWTQSVHECIKYGKSKLMEYSSKLQNQLAEVVNLVRGHLSTQARIALGALVVIDVHARDVVSNLIDNEVVDENDFNWLAQLRYYWLQDACHVRITNASFKYACEYLGNSGRLVITPLTDRCYRTLMGAFHLHLNGAPEGPAGTGKTETTKDLAKALAVQCVVFNCSDGLDYIAMGKGLASSGAWACFDEFNRIDLEVLSVVAQQILSITQAVQCKAKTFMFEGTSLQLNPNCYVCITMNPGYAGRSELPDNLKVLFRTVAMMVPDYAMIGEIILYSYGFINARTLSTKIVTTYRLCSEQLSSQSHYDYGMRAVKAVLAAAGHLKLKYPEKDENEIILKSILDINLPKFLSHDIPLFNGIVSDLFPNLSQPKEESSDFIDTIKRVCRQKNLQCVDTFIQKVTQSFEMMKVRHGFMLVGHPFSGKSKVLEVLFDVLNLLHKEGHKEYSEVIQEAVNPKALSLSQLFGHFDSVSHQWNDGVVAKIMREFSSKNTEERKWIIFDGPVDTLWIESMNTALDDNKKLCLMSGEIIQLSPSINMVFEVLDLSQASPATVSRCGMVYMEPTMLSWKSLVKSWLQVLPSYWNQESKTFVYSVLQWLIPPCLKFLREHCKELVSTNDSNLVTSMMHLVQNLIARFFEKNDLKDSAQILKMIGVCKVIPLLSVILFSVTWTLGATCDSDSRIKFNHHLQNFTRDFESDGYPSLFKQNDDLLYPQSESIYDYFYDYEGTRKWRLWKDLNPVESFDSNLNLRQMIVPTVDTARVSYFLDLSILSMRPTLFVGPTGTGKSVYIKNKLLHNLPRDNYLHIIINFSTQTSVSLTQYMVESKLSKHCKGVLGPSAGKQCLIFVDDLNMPAKDDYGSQPPIELLRQYMDYKNWYSEQNNLSKISLLDLLFVCAMLPPGGGSNSVSPRFLRHFHIMSINPFNEETLTTIFNTMLNTYFQSEKCSSEIKSLASKIVSSTQEIYKSVENFLLPTPAKAHYTFNLRDFSKVILGCCLMRPEDIKDESVLIRLWIHEVYRVFSDRLVNDPADRNWFFTTVKNCVQNHFHKSFEIVMPNLSSESEINESDMDNLIFGDDLEEDPSEENKIYKEIDDIDKYHYRIEQYLAEYNNNNSNQLNLVIFKYVLNHLSRICRVLKTPGGNALLVGVGGSGKQSLTQLAVALAGYTLFQPQITRNYSMNDWRDNLKVVLKAAGVQRKKMVLLITDSHIKDESFLEDINSLLNIGEVPSLFPKDEQQEVIDSCRSWVEGATTTDLSSEYIFSQFVEQCKENLHIILAFSPVGQKFKNRLRLYRSLVNCCTIDWFHNWPDDALEKVAHKFLNEININDQMKKECAVICKYFHVTASKLSYRFSSEINRKTYITPSSYLELISTFKRLIYEKQDLVMKEKIRYDVGLDKLARASKEVVKLKKELEELQPQLAVTKASTSEMIDFIAEESGEAEKFREIVRQDETQASKQAEQSQQLKQECENDLAEALPILDEALSALDTLKPSDISVVKSMKSPPNAVKLVMAAICVMIDMKPDRINDPSGSGMMINDYWGPSKRLLSDMSFLEKLKNYDKDNIPVHIITKIRKSYTNLEEFNPSVVAKASSAAEGLCMWLLAIEKYEKVLKVVGPKKIKLVEAEEQLSSTLTMLKEKQNELANAETKLKVLQQQLDEKNKHKAELEKEVDMCATKLGRAEQLIEDLGGEQDRWSATSSKLQMDYDNLTGDMLISSGIITYLGPFTSQFRSVCIDDWTQFVSSHNLTCSEKFSLGRSLSSPIDIQSWQMSGLPSDEFSVDNATVIQNSFKWPLLIDPQGQGNKWIKRSYGDSLTVIKISNPDCIRILENCIQFGRITLVEDCWEELDPMLLTILNKKTYKQGVVLVINVGDKIIEYNEDFKLFLTSKLPNPHYLPEISTKVTLINFMITSIGLQEQLLGILLAKERPDLEESRQDLIVQTAKNNKTLKEIEDKILHTLSTSAQNILDDESAIEVLRSSKSLANEISIKQKETVAMEKVIETSQSEYRPSAALLSTLFFTICDLANVDLMYQYSLDWFINLFFSSIKLSEKSDVLQIRLNNIKDHFMYNLYCNVCRSLLEKDKLLFSFTLSCNILLLSGELIEPELKFFLTGGIGIDKSEKNPLKSWLPDSNWKTLQHLFTVETFPSDFRKYFEDLSKEWEKLFLSVEPNLYSLPSPWDLKLSKFQKLMLLRSLRPDKITLFVMQFIITNLGEKFVNPPSFDLDQSFSGSSNSIPIIFILSQGADPMSALQKFSESKGFSEEKFCSISLGQGQFPISVLQNGVKLTNEPSSGLKMNLLQTYKSDPINDSKFYKSCVTKQNEFEKLLYCLCFFHAVVNERKKYGFQGWNNSYNFNESDLHISIRELQLYLNTYDEVPFDAINYLIGECNYGGRVTDDFDRRCLLTILQDFCNHQIISQDNYKFCLDKSYQVPTTQNYQEYVQYIQNLPFEQSPEVFGMHENIKISKDLQDSKMLTESILVARGVSKGTDGGSKFDKSLLDIISNISEQLPEEFDIDAAIAKYPIKYEESMNTVLVQELERFNRLLKVIKLSLETLKKAIQGEVVMSNEIESVGSGIAIGKIPNLWAAASYPTRKSLGSYIKDLIERINFFQNWFLHGKPAVFWISGFYFTQAFLTGAIQNYARKYSIPVDQLVFDFEVLPTHTCDDPPPDGVYIHGLYLDCARWDKDSGQLAEQYPKVLYDLMPIIWLKPVRKRDMSAGDMRYQCPVYKTSERRGQLTTTGHSTNYVITLLLNTQHPSSHWIKRGAALLCQLDD
ncbi:Dynein heavy chain 7, axonemal [Nymphon striatum]|nr:Dynein heavy chain 7, axonemal [Nymphon striatum]